MDRINTKEDISKHIQSLIKQNLQDHVPEESAWEEITKQPGLNIWRVNCFKLETIEETTDVTFCEGDSYILLRTHMSNGRLGFDIFMWIGHHSTADEYGTAAYKMTELDHIVLDGIATQNREVQSHESGKFLGLFRKFSVVKGGVKSGFRHVSHDPSDPRLLRVSGDRNHIHVEEVSYIKKNITKYDVFIIDNCDIVYQVNGSNANKEEKFNGAIIVNDIQGKRPKVNTEIIDGYCSDSDEPVIDAMPQGEKADFIKDVHTSHEPVLWKLSDALGDMQMTKIASGSCKKSLLDTKDVFIFHVDDAIYVWVGNETNKTEKMCSLAYAQKYSENTHEFNIPLVKVAEGNEPEEMLKLLE